jgi:pimeloyl-ACP methyl ester carboxylesterase
MNPPRRALRGLAGAAAAAALVLGGCATATRIPPAAWPPLPVPEEAARLTGQGPCLFRVEAGEMNGARGCLVRYERFLPAEARTPATVALGHGFFRDLTHMRGWAALWASWGVPVIIMSFCASTPFAGNHDVNAADMRTLTRRFGTGPVVYAGFSAGALAAFLAAGEDPQAVAFLGLDAVDSGGLAAPAARAFRLPALFLAGEPSDCNAGNNFLPAVPRSAGIGVLRIRFARHGHFENPYDPGLEGICGAVTPPEAAADIMTGIRALATAWVLERTGALPGAAGIVGDAWVDAPQWKGRLEILQAP